MRDNPSLPRTRPGSSQDYEIEAARGKIIPGSETIRVLGLFLGKTKSTRRLFKVTDVKHFMS